MAFYPTICVLGLVFTISDYPSCRIIFYESDTENAPEWSVYTESFAEFREQSVSDSCGAVQIKTLIRHEMESDA